MSRTYAGDTAVSQREPHTIERGAIFVQDNAFLPKTLHLESKTEHGGWARVANQMNGAQLETTLTAAGWTSFYLAGSIQTTVFGFDRQKMASEALKRLIVNMSVDRCNCLEIDEVTTHSWLGLPYLRLLSHARQIQEKKVTR
jgi:hypothetical protein